VPFVADLIVFGVLRRNKSSRRRCGEYSTADVTASRAGKILFPINYLRIRSAANRFKHARSVLAERGYCQLNICIDNYCAGEHHAAP
jgi:hypothetical protein